MNWTLPQLRTFQAIHEFGSLSAAADELGLTISAVSQQMTALAQAVGKPLFVRSGRALALTDAGVTLLDRVGDLLRAEEQAIAALNGELPDSQLVVRLGVFGSAAVTSLRPIIERLRGVAPEVRVRAYEVDVEVMAQEVAAGSIDLALGVDYRHVPIPPLRGVTTERLIGEHFHIVLPSDVHAEDLSKREVIRWANQVEWIPPPSTTAFGKAARFTLAQANIEPRAIHVVSDTAVSLALADSGVGATLATPLMMSLSAQPPSTYELPGEDAREIVSIVSEVAQGRDSVQAVVATMKMVFATNAMRKHRARQGPRSEG